MAKYLEDRNLYYEMVLSTGKGKLTKKAEHYLILIANNTIRKKIRNYNSDSDMQDCLQEGMLHLFKNWKGFNHKKFDLALPYFTELFKRGTMMGFNTLINKKSYNEGGIKTISIDRANEGKGLHNI